MLVFGLKSTLVLGVVLLLTRGTRLTAAARHLLLLLGLVSLPLLALLGRLPEPAWQLPAADVVNALQPAADWSVAVWPQIQLDLTAPALPSMSRVPLDVLAWRGYWLVAGGLLLVWLARIARTALWMRRARRLPEDRQSDVQMRESADLRSPIVWGAFTPEIVVPESWPTWSAGQRRAVLAHEHAHVARRDTLTSLLGALICCVFWLQPLAWLACRRLRIEAECACDDAVVNSGVPALAYAESLLDMARTREAVPGLAATAMAARPTLPVRIRALLAENTRRTPMTSLHRIALTIVALAVVVPLGATGAASDPAPLHPASSDGDIRPLVKVAPVYPAGAARDRIEGWVLVEFTVDESGATRDARVVESDPVAVFDQAALDAVRRYRYEPRVEDGMAVAASGIRNRIRFALGDESPEALKEPPPAPLPPDAPPPPTPISAPVFDELANAQALVDAGEHEAALQLLDTLLEQAPGLNGNELAQVHNLRGFTYYSMDDYWRAVFEYEQILDHSASIPRGLELTTRYTLAQLNFVLREYELAIEHMQSWMVLADTPGPTPLVFLGQVYYQLNDYPQAIEQLTAGIDEAESRDIEVRENWLALLVYLYHEEERLEEALATLETLESSYPSDEYRARIEALRGRLGQAAS